MWGGRKEGSWLQHGSEGGAGTVLGVRVMQAGLRDMVPWQMLAQSEGTWTRGKGLCIVRGVRCVHVVCAV